MSEPAKNEIGAVNDASASSPLVTTETQNSTPALDPKHAFVQKCVHPPTAVPSFEGLPTNDSRSQVCVEWVDSRMVENPTTTGALNTPVLEVQPASVEGYAFLCTTGMNFPIIAFTKGSINGASSSHWYPDTRNTKVNDVYDVNNIWKDASLYRKIYGSLTTYLNATAFNDTGMVSMCQFNPAILFTGTLPQFFESKPAKAHRFVDTLLKEGYVFDQDSEWDYDIKQRFKTHFPPKSADPYVVISKQPPKGDKSLKITPDMEFQIINFGNQGNSISGNSGGAIVPTSSQVMNSSQRSFVTQAKEGSFTVQRLNNIGPKWYATSHNQIAASPNGLFECWFSFTDNLNVDNFKRFVYENNGISRTCLDTFWSDDMTWTWVVYDGLVPDRKSVV